MQGDDGLIRNQNAVADKFQFERRRLANHEGQDIVEALILPLGMDLAKNSRDKKIETEQVAGQRFGPNFATNWYLLQLGTQILG